MTQEKQEDREADAETALLGSILLTGGDALNEVVLLLKPESFRYARNAIVYKAVCKLFGQSVKADVVSVYNEIVKMDALDIVDAAYVAGLTDVVATAANIRYYAQIICEDALRRTIINTGNEYIAAANNTTNTSQQLIDIVVQKTADITGESTRQESVNRDRSPDEMDKEATDGDDVYPCSPLDNIKFKYGTISFIGARTSRGKTTMLTSIAIDALQAGRAVYILTLEETDDQILRRLRMCLAIRMIQATETGANYTAVQKNECIDALMNELDPYNKGMSNPIAAYKAWRYDVVNNRPQRVSDTFSSALNNARNLINTWYKDKQLVIHNGICESLTALALKARTAKTGDVVLFDYAQLAPAEDKVTDSYGKKVAVNETDKALLVAAQAKKSIIIAGAQFNRSSTGEDDLGYDTFSEASFADCGDMETIGHILIGVGWESGNHDARFYKVLKNREGTSGSIYDMTFVGAYSYLWTTGKARLEDAFVGKKKELWKALSSAVKTKKTDKQIAAIVRKYVKAAQKGKNATIVDEDEEDFNDDDEGPYGGFDVPPLTLMGEKY